MSGTGLAEQRRNYATNPSFETNASGWVSVGTSSVNRSTTRAWVGSSSGLVTLGAGPAPGQGASHTVTGLAVGETYTASAYVWVPSASIGANLALFIFGVAFGVSSAVATPDTWVRISVTWTATSSSHTVALLNGATSTAGQTAYIDGLLVEKAATAGAYFDGATTDSGDTSTLGSTIYDWTGTAHASQSVQSLVIQAYTITATVEDDQSPQRVRIDVEAAPSTGVAAVTVTRTDPSGRVLPVRTEDGQPLQLVVSETIRVGTVYDYEAPYGQPVVYSTVSQPTVLSEPVTVHEDRVWLIHPGIPARSVPIELMRGSFDEEEEDVAGAVFYALGRRNGVVFTDGRRKAPAGTLIVGTETAAESRALGELLADAFPLLLNVPPLLGIEVDTNYVHLGRLRRVRPSDVGSDPQRNWMLPFQVVEMPVGGTQSQRTFQNVLDESETFQQVLDAYATFADLQAPTT